MPNKLFEYIAAGIPTIVLNAKEAGEFVEKHELGVFIKDINDIPKIYADHQKYRRIVREKRHQFTAESQAEKIVRIYDSIISKKDEAAA